MKKAVAIVLLSVAIVLSISACNNTDAESNSADSRIGYGIYFGGTVWRILDVQEDRVLIISEDILEVLAYHSQNAETTWEQCDLRAYLNGEFYEAAFSEQEQKDIIETTIINGKNSEFGTSGGNKTLDKVFLLSMDEAESYFSSNPPPLNPSDEEGIFWWWLRTPGESGNRATCVHNIGGILDTGGLSVDEARGVRPVLWLRIDLDEIDWPED